VGQVAGKRQKGAEKTEREKGRTAGNEQVRKKKTVTPFFLWPPLRYALGILIPRVTRYCQDE